MEFCKCSFCLKVGWTRDVWLASDIKQNGVIWKFPVSDEELMIENGDDEMIEYEFGVRSNTHLVSTLKDG